MPRAKRKRVQRAAEKRRMPRAVLLAGLAILIAAAVVAIVIAIRPRAESVTLTPFPPPPAPPTDSIEFTDFVGSDRCAGCHRAQYAAWTSSTHGRAGQAPPRDLPLRRFDGTPIRFRDATVEPRVSGGSYEFVVKWAGRTDRFPIVGVVGGGHMVGGGTQGFLWRHEDGSLRLLPFELTSTDRAWFCSTGTRANQGWVRITERMSIADCGDWPPVRVMGSSARYASCQECHGSQIELRAGDRPNQTRFQSLSINCESCHGPGQRHIDLVARQPRTEDIGLQPLATLSKDASVGVCMSCHALKVDVRRGYLPGRPLEERYSLKLPLLDDDELYADGRTRTFAYQQGHLYSDCYLSGAMTCVDCHEPHGQQYRDITGRRLEGRFDDAQCTACHASKAERPELHTRHAATSPGSRCVTCHMPFVQETAVGDQVRYTRSDHTISIPRAQLDQQLGVVNACRNCHQQQTPEQLAAETRRLWGELKPLRPVVASLIQSETLDDLEEIVLAADTAHGLAYFDALARVFSRLDAVDAGMLPRRLESRLWQLTESRDDDHAAIALATLHLDSGREPRMRARLIERLRGLDRRDLSVRRRWAIALGHRGDALRERGRNPEAITLYEKALELLPDDPTFLMALGLAHFDNGDPVRASDVLRRALTIEPTNSLAWSNYGRARAAAGDPTGAMTAYLRATEADPYDAIAFFNLGNAQLRAGNRDAAATAYRRATELDLSLAPAHFNLARALLLQGREQEALAAIRSGLVFDPDQAEARQVATQLEAKFGTAR